MVLCVTDTEWGLALIWGRPRTTILWFLSNSLCDMWWWHVWQKPSKVKGWVGPSVRVGWKWTHPERQLLSSHPAPQIIQFLYKHHWLILKTVWFAVWGCLCWFYGLLCSGDTPGPPTCSNLIISWMVLKEHAKYVLLVALRPDKQRCRLRAEKVHFTENWMNELNNACAWWVDA